MKINYQIKHKKFLMLVLLFFHKLESSDFRGFNALGQKSLKIYNFKPLAVNLTSELYNPYHLDESSFIFWGIRIIFPFLFHLLYLFLAKLCFNSML